VYRVFGAVELNGDELLTMGWEWALRTVAHTMRPALQQKIREADADRRPLVTRPAPSLVALPGVGIETAELLLITARDNPGRIRSDAPFAHRCTAA